jgi:endothelin-converting enzyme/putative endopeptidase
MKNVFALVLAAAAVAAPVRGAEEQPPAPKNLAAFNPAYLDRDADPCQDFYQFACGTWIKNNPVPSDQSTWSPFDELYLNNLVLQQGILEKAAVQSPGRSPIEQKIGDFYASCMDVKAIDAHGIAPLKDDLDRIAQLKDRAGLTSLVAHLHTLGVGGPFDFGSKPDAKNSRRTIALAAQGGLGLPSRDYYFKEDARSAEIRAKYLAHLQKFFELLGDPADKATAEAKAVFQLETGLAKASLTPAEERDPEKVYNLLKLADLQALTPTFRWQQYLKEVGAPPLQELNVVTPDFFKAVEAQLKNAPLEDWKAYFRIRLVHSVQDQLPSPFVEEAFAFEGATLSGIQEIQPRWKRCIQYTDQNLGEALGQKYVEVAFGPESRQRMATLVQAILKSLDQDIKNLDWMSAETKKQALVKLGKINTKIGFPEKWRDYSTYRIERGEALANVQRGAAYELRRQLAKIGKPTDNSEWLITPPTVNAYYLASANDINFPAGILQPPFFDVRQDDAVNFGAIGAVIGHELTHGFDDEGRQFDADGNLRDWWTPADGKAFDQRVSCIENQYSGYTAVGDTKVNGKLTLGENTADSGGVRIAYMALQDRLKGKTVEKIDGFTPEQRLFLAWSQIWCENATPEGARRLALTNPHAPGRYRANGVMVNMPEFAQAFQCKPGDAMVKPTENRCRVW